MTDSAKAVTSSFNIDRDMLIDGWMKRELKSGAVYRWRRGGVESNRQASPQAHLPHRSGLRRKAARRLYASTLVRGGPHGIEVPRASYMQRLRFGTPRR